MKILIILILLPFSLISWEQTGPPGVNSRYMVIDDMTGYVYYTSYINKLYKIDPQTNTWTYLETPESSKRIYSIDAYNDHIFLGREDHILHSPDGGETWQYAENGIGHDIQPQNIKICRTEPNIILVQVGFNIWYRSIDNGLYWLQTDNLGSDLIDFSPTSDFVIVFNSSNMWKSFDNGESWIVEQSNLNPSFFSFCVTVINDTTYITAGLNENDLFGENNVFITHNGGQSWENINFGSGFGFPIGLLFYNDKIFINVARYLTEQNTGIFELDSENETWNRIGSGFFIENSNFAMDGYNNKIFAASFYEDLFITDLVTNNTINLQPDNYYDKIIGALKVNPSFNNNLVAMQSYAYISEDYGYNWTRLDSVYNVFDVTNSEYDPDVYIASRIKRGIYMSYDGAQTWIESNNGIAEEDRLLIDKAYFLSENTMIFSGFKSNEGEHNQTFIYRSEDQGLSWNLIMESDLNLGEPMISIQALCKVDDIFYTALLSGIIMKSEDYGLTWEYTFEIENRKFRQLLYDFQNSIFYIRAVDTEAIPGKYIIYRSYDSFNWEECSYSFHNDFSTFNISLNPNEPGDIFASVRNRDGIELEHPHFYYSHNCGDSWQPVYLDGFSPTDYIVTMNIIPETNEMLICPGESSIFRNELNFVSACNEIITNITPINLTNYPNPFTSETTISFSLTDEKAESTEICIYNIKGQKVKQFPDIENQNSITWNATDEYDKQVSNGVYFYKLRVNNINKAVRKMILIR